MSDEELRAIKARCEAATPEPWGMDMDDWHWIKSTTGVRIAGNFEQGEGGICSTPDDATFICHARTDVPALVAEVERLRAQIRILEWS